VLSGHWKNENLTFLAICTQKNWMSTWYFNPRWNLMKASFQHSASALDIYIHEGGLSAQCKRWKNKKQKCTIFFSISLLKSDWKFWILELDRSAWLLNFVGSKTWSTSLKLKETGGKEFGTFFQRLHALGRKPAFIKFQRLEGWKYQVLIQFFWVHMAKKVKFSFFQCPEST